MKKLTSIPFVWKLVYQVSFAGNERRGFLDEKLSKVEFGWLTSSWKYCILNFQRKLDMTPRKNTVRIFGIVEPLGSKYMQLNAWYSFQGPPTNRKLLIESLMEQFVGSFREE